MPDRCIVATVVVGDRYRRLHRLAFAPSLERYAARHGYELLVIDEPLFAAHAPSSANEESGYSRYLIASLPEVAGASRLMYVDADMIVSPTAPAFHELELGGRIGVVDEWAQPTSERRVEYQLAHGFEASPREYYARAGFDVVGDTMVNAGMFVCEPRRHGSWLAELARRHAPIGATHPRGPHYEQAAFGATLAEDDMAEFLPAHWNRIWPVQRWASLGTRSSSGPGPATADPRARFQALRLLRQTLEEPGFMHMTAGVDHDLAAILNAARSEPTPAAPHQAST